MPTHCHHRSVQAVQSSSGGLLILQNIPFRCPAPLHEGSLLPSGVAEPRMPNGASLAGCLRMGFPRGKDAKCPVEPGPSLLSLRPLHPVSKQTPPFTGHPQSPLEGRTLQRWALPGQPWARRTRGLHTARPPCSSVISSAPAPQELIREAQARVQPHLPVPGTHLPHAQDRDAAGCSSHGGGSRQVSLDGLHPCGVP